MRKVTRRRCIFDTLEPRLALTADPVISEFLALNQSSVTDVDGDNSDFIEIYNPGDTPIDLDGWYLTDEIADPSKWRIPDVELAPRDYLVIFASNKDRQDPAAELHTNFRISGSGGYLALIKPDGVTPTTEFNPYPVQIVDVAYGLGTSSTPTNVVSPVAAASVHIPTAVTGPALDQAWTATGYAQGTSGETWSAAQTGVGYDVDNQYDSLLGPGGDLESQMRNVNPGAYIRVPFSIDDPDAIDRLTLRMKYDDGFVAYLNGEEIVTRNVGSVSVQPQNLVALYRFDETSGTTAADSTGRSAAGNLVNFPTNGSQWTTGRVGRALEFRGGGSSDYVIVPNYFKATTSMSASAWVRADSRPTWASIIKNWGGGVGGQFHFGLNNNDGRLSNYLDASSTSAIAPTTFPIGSWEHVAFVADAAAGQMTIYQNGVAVVSSAYDGALLNSAMNSMGIGVKTNDTGTGPDPASPGYWDGAIDEVAIWNSAVSASEMLSIYSAGLQGVGLAASSAGGSQSAWNTTAAGDRPDALATQFESFDLSGVRSLLQPGTNVLAIHGVNVSAADADFLIVPELTVETVSVNPNNKLYLVGPTPGAANGSGVTTLGPIISSVTHEVAAAEIVTTPLVSSTSPVSSLIPANGTLADEWLNRDYVQGAHGESWTSSTGSIGFDNDGAFAGLIGGNVAGAMQNVNATAYLRAPFQVNDLSAVDRLKLRMKYDDGFVAYLNGVEVARANAPASNIRSGLVAYYDFDNNLTDRADDFANNTGTTTDNLTAQAGTLRYVPGKRGQAVALNADLDTIAPDDARRLEAAASADVQMASTYTLEAWINPTALLNVGRIVGNFGTSFQYRLELQSGNRLALVHRQANGASVTALSPPGAIVTGAWQHVAGVADGTMLRVYVNGVQVGETPYNGTFAAVNEPLAIGDRPGRNDGVLQQYEGYIDELAMWDVPLSAAEVLAHFQGDTTGYGLVPNPAPGISYQAAATAARPDAAAIVPQEFDLTSVRNLLVPGTNVLAIHGLNQSASDADFLIAPELVAESGHPTLPPVLVQAAVFPTFAAVQSVTLHYRVMYGAEQTLPMFDDGFHGDASAGDGIYGAKIPGGTATAGQMLRWYVRATDTDAASSRNPTFANPNESEQYYGTVMPDPAISSPLPVFQWFVENPGLAETGTGTRATVFYDGELYDNVYVRIRGDTARNWPKKSYKFDFHRGHHFRYADDQLRVEEFNLNATYTDKSYVRALLSFGAYRDAGVPYSQAFAMHVRQNGSFYSLAHFVEQPDEEYLERNGLDVNGALYKISYAGNPVGLSSTAGAEKRNRKEEDFSDLQALINGLAQSGAALERYLLDNVNLAEVINYMAASIIVQNIDRTVKNFYVYRDTENTGEWQMLPWDVDLAFGPNALNTDVIEAADDSPNQHTSHPYLGGADFPYTGLQNRLLDAIYRNPITNEMYERRLRTLMDELLNAPGTPVGERYFETQLDQYVALLQGDVNLDRAKWGSNAHFGGTTYTLQQAVDRIKNEYLAPRRTHLFETHTQSSTPDPVVTILPSSAQAFAHVPRNGNLGLSWTQTGFQHDAWLSGATGIGYDEEPTYGPLLGLDLRNRDIPEAQRIDTNQDDTNEYDSVYVRVPFSVSNLGTINRLTLRMKYDDAFIAYINGVEVARSSTAPAGATWNSSSNGINDDNAAQVFQNFDVTPHIGLLNAGANNILAIHLMNDATNGPGTSTDMLVMPELVSGTPSTGGGVGLPSAQPSNPNIEIASFDYNPVSRNQDEEYIELFNPNTFAVDVSRWKIAGGVTHTFTPGTVIPAGKSLYVVSDAPTFRARATGPSGGQGLLIQGNYQGHLSNLGETLELISSDSTVIDSVTTPSTPSLAQQYLRITEIMYHPPAPSLEESELGFFDQDDFEYIELTNISNATTPTTLDLAGVRFTQGLTFDFTTAAITSLAPGESILVVRSPAAIAARYGNDVRIAGVFDDLTGLSNGGEQIQLEDIDNGTIHDFDYEDDWYPETDGLGYSLVPVDVLQNVDAWDGKTGWRLSTNVGGSPGRSDDQLAGDVNSDGSVNLIDLAIIQSHFGLTSGATREQGDLTGDGAIDRRDVALLAANFGKSSSPSPAPSAPSAVASIVSEPRRIAVNEEARQSTRRRRIAIAPALSDVAIEDQSASRDVQRRTTRISTRR